MGVVPGFPERRLLGLQLDFAPAPEPLPTQFLPLHLQLTPDPVCDTDSLRRDRYRLHTDPADWYHDC